MSLARPLTLLVSCLVSLGAAQAAESVAVVVFASDGVASADAALLEKAAHVALGNLSSFEPKDVEVTADATCAERPGCLIEMAKLSGTDHLLVLVARPSARNTVSLEGVHVTPAGIRFMSEARAGIDPFDADAVLPSVLMGVLPKYGARGFGGLEVRAPADAQVKIDGHLAAGSAPAGPLPVVAGVHEIDVKLSPERSVLYRQAVAAGERSVLDVKPFSELRAAPVSASGEGLRIASYGVFSAGAVAVAASLVFGGLARSSLNGITSCTGEIRDCSYMEDARSMHARGERFASVGNGLGVLGGILMVSGGGLFAFDLLGGDLK